jgi:hypothetical protein
MTNDEYKPIADALRHRVNEIKTMFQEPGVIVDDIPRAMKIQVCFLRKTSTLRSNNETRRLPKISSRARFRTK